MLLHPITPHTQTHTISRMLLSFACRLSPPCFAHFTAYHLIIQPCRFNNNTDRIQLQFTLLSPIWDSSLEFLHTHPLILSHSLKLYLSLSLSIYLYFCLWLSVSPFLYLSLCPSLSFCLSVYTPPLSLYPNPFTVVFYNHFSSLTTIFPYCFHTLIPSTTNSTRSNWRPSTESHNLLKIKDEFSFNQTLSSVLKVRTIR